MNELTYYVMYGGPFDGETGIFTARRPERLYRKGPGAFFVEYVAVSHPDSDTVYYVPEVFIYNKIKSSKEIYSWLSRLVNVETLF